MHDPMTVAFDIKRPWPQRATCGKEKWYWPTLITIWHVDPERDGTDDSCGWSSPPMSEADRQIIHGLVEEDLKFPYFSSPSLPLCGVVVDPNYKYPQMTPGDSLAMTACAWMLIAKEKAHRTGRDHGGWRRIGNLTTKEWFHVVQLATYPHDNLRSCLVSQDVSPKERAEKFLWCVMRAYNRFHRHWWQHPRWHIWHWKIQIHPLQSFKRWAFSCCCCCRCGKGFTWGYSPTTDSWNSAGPQWFRSEKNVYHSDCRGEGRR